MWICPLAVNANAMQCWWLWLPAVRPPVRPSTVQVDHRCVRRPRFQVGFVDSLLGTDYNQTTISRKQETSSTPSAASMLWHRFSAFWLRSSVVSVLISLISDTLLIEQLIY